MKVQSILISLLLISMLVFVMGVSGCPQIPSQGNCPTKLNPPCGSVEQAGEFSPTAVGGLVLDSCDCPPGTEFSGTRDTISAGGPYKICTCI